MPCQGPLLAGEMTLTCVEELTSGGFHVEFRTLKSSASFLMEPGPGSGELPIPEVGESYIFSFCRAADHDDAEDPNIKE